MNRYPLILLIALALCIPALMADGRPAWAVDSGYTWIENHVTKGATDTLDDVKARYATLLDDKMTTYGQQVQNFGTTYIQPYNSSAAGNLNTKVNEYVTAYKQNSTEFNITDMNSKVTEYLGDFGTQCQGIINTLNASSDSGVAAIKASYGENAKDLVQYFMQDVKDKNVLDKSAYTADFDLLKKYVDDRLGRAQRINNNNSGRHQFNPMSYLDKGLPDVTRERMEVNIACGGIRAGDSVLIYGQAGTENPTLYANMSARDLIEKVNSKFGNYDDLQSELSWYTANWNNEMNVTESQVDNPASDLYPNINQNGFEASVNQPLTVNEYGHLSAESALPLSVEPYRMLDNLYNNRNYGRRFSDGVPYDTVSVTVGGRKYQLYDQFYTSPLVLDLDGDGKLEASKGEWLPHKYDNSKLVEFDIDGDQFLELTEWVGANDGILLVGYEKGKDINANHMFGEAGGYKNGFEKLSLFDTNGDKKISGDELKTLSVWQDRNNNAKVDDGEVTAITDLGITELSLTNEQLASSFVMKGENRKMWDWYPTYFRIKKDPK